MGAIRHRRHAIHRIKPGAGINGRFSQNRIVLQPVELGF